MPPDVEVNPHQYGNGHGEKTVKVAQGLENMALTTAMDRPARVSTRINENGHGGHAANGPVDFF